MKKIQPHAPRQYQGVIVSSTFTDLEPHRTILMEALRKEELFAIGMEEYIASPEDDIISSSLNMVQKSSAYIGLISHRYGQIPKCPKRNSSGYSITRIEFEEAKRLKMPTLIFVMGDEHPVKRRDVETDSVKIKKLEAFKKKAKRDRIYMVFNNIDDFTSKAIHAASSLRRSLEEKEMTFTKQSVSPSTSVETKTNPIPKPPDFYAVPPYIGSHKFIGRLAQLDTLSDWASSSDSHCIMLIEAIGGTGKSMLTWEWATKYSANIRKDWSGRFWYSFYSKGATMVDFCRRTLAYLTCQPYSSFIEKNTAELTEILLHYLQANPWLLILDGIERVLVSYHRYDSAQLLDEEAGTSDKIARRHPCAAINPEDEDLLRVLSGAFPSKILLTSRLIPRVLLNQSNQPIPGVLREHLPGLRPKDAESLIRACGITGVSQNIQHYLKKHCDCHPLVIGVLAGLINDYLPNRGNFDDWASDPIGGGELNLANLDLVQKRNHILNAAISALPEASLQLLSILALFSNSVDYATLSAFNPFVSPIPEEIPIPKNPEKSRKWRNLNDNQKPIVYAEYMNAVHRRKVYEKALSQREKEKRATTNDFIDTVKDLERRGLLQYDAVTKRYDLHPVVRGISAGGLKGEERNRYGQRVVDHFSQQAQDPYDNAETLEDFDKARHIIKVLFQMGNMVEARNFLSKNPSFLQALNYRFEAHNEILTIIRPFFSSGWDKIPDYLIKTYGLQLAGKAAVSLLRIGALQEAREIATAAIRISLKNGSSESSLFTKLLNLASIVGEQNNLALEDRLLVLANNLIINSGDRTSSNSFNLARFRQLSTLGKWTDAESIWLTIANEVLPNNTQPIAAHHYVVYLYLRDLLTEEYLVNAEELNRRLKSALGIRNLCILRGIWQLQLENFEAAKRSLQTAVTLAHQVGKVDRRSEICLAIAKYKLKELSEPTQVGEQFANIIEDQCHYYLAYFYSLLGDREKAKKHSFAAYKWAWADGIPYVRHFELNRAIKIIEELGEPIPILEPYNSTKDKKLPLEDEIATAIERIMGRKKF